MTAISFENATSVPTPAPDEPPLLEHAYDGIREYDNPLPGWWKMTFIACIVFAAGYFIAYSVTGWGATPAQMYSAALIHYESTSGHGASVQATASEDSLTLGSHDPATLSHGAEVFVAKCAGCHTPDGRGLIGPNLTDLFQLHGATRVDLFTTIRDGVPNTAMPAWGDQLPAVDVVSVATYVTTLRGKNIAGGKAPQGQKVQPF